MMAVNKSRFIRPILKYTKKYLYNIYFRHKVLSENMYPPQVWIENTNCCNASCLMCPRERLTRPLGFMKMTLFEKIVKEIAQQGNKVKRVHLHNFGEPLLDKEIIKRIELAKSYNIKHVYFVTNASLLSCNLSERIIKAGLDEFKISFYGTDKETYNNTMRGLDFERTINNVKEFLKIREKMDAKKPKVIIQYIPQASNKLKVEEFKNVFRQIINRQIGDSLNIFSLLNFGDGRNYHNIERGIVCSICTYPWRTMVILYDGKVVPCCIDYNGVQVLGDINKNTISEIWNTSYNRLRDDFKRVRYDSYPICKKCDVIY